MPNPRPVSTAIDATNNRTVVSMRTWPIRVRAGGLTRTKSRNDAPRRERAEGSAHEGEEHAFGEQLAYETELAGAQRRADGDFAASGRGPHEEKVRDVGARDEQHEADGGEKNHQTQPDVFHEKIVGANHRHVRIAGAIVSRDTPGNGLQVGGRRLRWSPRH